MNKYSWTTIEDINNLNNKKIILAWVYAKVYIYI